MRFGRIVENRILVKESENTSETRHISILVEEDRKPSERNPGNHHSRNPDTSMYSAGDVVTVLPEQCEKRVEALCRRFNLSTDIPVDLQKNLGDEAGNPGDAGGGGGVDSLHRGVRLGDLIQGTLDCTGASPAKWFFELLEYYCPSTASLEKEKLRFLISAEGSEDLYIYNKREHRTVAEVLSEFPSVKLPLSHFLDACPILQPRSFSIASAPSQNPRKIELCVKMVSQRTPDGRLRRGLCTSWFKNIPIDSIVSIWIEAGKLRLPDHDPTKYQRPPNPHPSTFSSRTENHLNHLNLIKSPKSEKYGDFDDSYGNENVTERGTGDSKLPLILVGPGTGFAPLRSLIQERILTNERLRRGRPGPILLFFGCKHRERDHIYREEMESWRRRGVFGNGGGVFYAYSRDQAAKRYVTDDIEDHGDLVWKLIQQGARIIVSGSAKQMPDDVFKSFRKVAAQHGNMSIPKAARFVQDLEKAGRYLVEAW